MFIANASLMWAIAGLFTVLAGGTVARMVTRRGTAAEVAKPRVDSLKTWWSLAVLLTAAVAFGERGVLILVSICGVLGLREYLGLVGWKAIGHSTATIVWVLVAMYYLSILSGLEKMARDSGPVVFLIVLGAIRASLRLVDGYIRTTAAVFWGLMLFVFCLSHAYFLVGISDTVEPTVGSVGWFLYLVILTETNDIAQAIVGRRFGKTKITPLISPNKSLEGLLGGILVTMTLAVLLAPWLTTLMVERTSGDWIFLSILSGVLISVFGFLGDINMSGIKRDVGVKDGSSLLPGQGGMMDRVDSLTFTAPVFYYFVRIMLL